MLTIRNFIQGKDEEVWLKVLNSAFKEYDDFRPGTMEDMEKAEKSPNFDATGRFIAEWNGEPVGCVNAYVDKRREEKKGFIRNFGVAPESRRKGIGKALVEKAIKSLKERGMEQVEAWTEQDKVACKSLYESMGFQVTRVFSEMRRELENIPSNIGEHKEVEMRAMEVNMDDIKLLNWLENESFKEHFNFRPQTIEETKFFVENRPWCDIAEYFFAYLDDKPVGHVGVGIDTKFIKHKGIKRGWIMTIGVLKPLRKQGIGTTLMLHALKFLKSKGMKEADLGVDDSNPTKAIELYDKVGFKLIKKDVTYHKTII
ncbi:MAG: GNAT family N-acetyltransferase [Candidatus Bathyarchaeota archaeon]|jgi:mycothiol synthase